MLWETLEQRPFFKEKASRVEVMASPGEGNETVMPRAWEQYGKHPLIFYFF